MAKVISVKGIYGLGILSQEASWKELLHKIELMGLLKDGAENVLLDFKGINVADPYRSISFMKMLRYENLQFKFYGLGKAYEQLKIMCIMDGHSEDKVINVEREAVKKPTKIEITIASNAKELGKHFRVNGDIAEITIKEKYGQMKNSLSAKYIEKATIDLLEENPTIKEVILDLKGIDIDMPVIDVLVDIKLAIEEEYGVTIAFDIEREDIIEKIQLYLHKKVHKEYSHKEKVEEVRKIPVGTAGVLISYKKSNKLDAFGRQGNGSVASARIATFDGVTYDTDVNGNKTAYAEFTTYNKNSFYTREHWMLQNDGENLQYLNKNCTRIKIDELGVFNKFLGSKAHFARPIQEDKSESIVMWSVRPHGGVVSKEYTLPERIKTVFDDFEVQYNKEYLEEDIRDTEVELRKKGETDI